MRPLLSEFTYGYGLTEELVRYYLPPLVAVPLFPSLRQEGQPGGGYDLRLDCPGIVLFLQFKLSDGMVYRNAAEVHQGIMTVPFFRMHLRAKRISNQHDMLISLENSGETVYYVAPLFHKDTEMNCAYLSRSVFQQSRFFSPSGIGCLPDDNDHHVAFRSTGASYLCSEPKEIKMFSPEAVLQQINSQSVSPAMTETPSLEEALRNARRHMLEILRRSRIIEGTDDSELARQLPNFPQDIASQVSYLAITFFDCATIPIIRLPSQDGTEASE